MIKYFIILITPLYIFAHSLVLNVMDNENGTITIEGAFSTGESASGALVKLESIVTKEILYEKRLDDESELTVSIPTVAYKVILDGGPGHSVSQEGIEPKGGFKKVEKDQIIDNKNLPSLSNSIKINYIITFILLLTTIFIGIYNTNRLLKELKRKR